MMSVKKHEIARREFLSAIGKAVGGSAMLRVMAAMSIGSTFSACGSSSAAPPSSPRPPPPQPSDSPRPEDWPPNVGSGKTVTILGAGIAGLVAGLEMTRLGYACTILEARASAGGRVRTIRGGDLIAETDSIQTCQFDIDDRLYFNAGPSRIPQHHELLLGYCRDFGVALETFTNDNRGAWLHSPNAFGGEPQVARTLIADTRGGIARLLSSAINQNALDQELTAIDKANVLAMLRQFGDLDFDNHYGPTPRAGFPGQEDSGGRRRGDLLPTRELQQLVTETFWESRLSFSQGFDQQPTMLQPVGGMDNIARAFANQVDGAIVYEANVTEIRKTTSGTRVVFVDRSGMASSIESDYCIVTIPAPVLASIPSDFSSAHRVEIAGFQYSSAVRVAFQSSRFWEHDHNIYGGITWTEQDITQIWYPSHDYHGSSGIVVGAYIFDGAAGVAFTDLSPLERVDTTVQQASNVHPQFMNEARHGISVAWKKIPFQLGGWGTSLPSALLTNDDHIFFAGEHLSILQGWQEGAILSAYSAIGAIVARDLGT